MICGECQHIGDYTTAFPRSPHYCCELIWQLARLDYKVEKDSVDEKCPLPYIEKGCQEWKKIL